MFFKRKIYEKMLEWKKDYADKYALLLEGARRVGKSTIAEQFAKNEYKSYVMIDFSTATKDVLECFEDVVHLDMFFLRIQAITGVTLFENNSVIIFDEVQFFPKARQAIKHLVKDGRFHYIETGSLISIKKNVKDILIPSEEMKVSVYPMDYEEFCEACNLNYNSIRELYKLRKPIGQDVNRKLMKNFRLYMAVGGMPQAVEAFVAGKNFAAIDLVKRQIIKLYEDDFKKLDPSGRLSMIFRSIPAQLSKAAKRYRLSNVLGKRKTAKDNELVYELIDSKTVLPAFNSTDPRVSLSLTKDLNSFKLYLLDTGLFVTLMFIDRSATENEIYVKLLSDNLPANLGYLYENAVAQMLTSKNLELYYHTWEKKNSTHYYEVDFLVSKGVKLSAIEVKSSGTGKHESLTEFQKKFSQNVNECYLVSQKDFQKQDGLTFLPVYMADFLQG